MSKHSQNGLPVDNFSFYMESNIKSIDVDKIENQAGNTFSDLFEKNVKQIIENREAFLPLYIKGFSDSHREYIKYIEQMFKIVKISEEKYFGNIDESTAKMQAGFVNMLFKSHLSQTEMSKEFLKNYLEMNLSIMKSWNSPLEKIVDVYHKQIQSS
ncbi:MAG: hypothetical protein ACE5RL_04990 [Nitrosarchaeum sp.]